MMKKTCTAIFLIFCLLLCGCESVNLSPSDEKSLQNTGVTESYKVMNDGVPEFEKSEFTTESYETYGELDALGRCTSCMACIGEDLMPTEERGEIHDIKPTGWQICEYDFIDDRTLYNRCHLIGYQLTGENDNEKNLITGTRYMNVKGMLPFENRVASYIRRTHNHVLYRVTPVFDGNNLIASGVHMEAESVEDYGKGIMFNVYAYNIQPGVVIDYSNGDNWEESMTGQEEHSYVLNTSSKKFHRPDCKGVKDISADNRENYTGTRGALLNRGYVPCGWCHP